MERGKGRGSKNEAPKQLINQIRVKKGPEENLSSGGVTAAAAASGGESRWGNYANIVVNPIYEIGGSTRLGDNDEKESDHDRRVTVLSGATPGATLNPTTPAVDTTATVVQAENDFLLLLSTEEKQPAAKGPSSSAQKQKNWTMENQSYTPPVHVPLSGREELHFGPLSGSQQAAQNLHRDTGPPRSGAMRNLYPQECYDRPLELLPAARSSGGNSGNFSSSSSSSSTMSATQTREDSLTPTYNLSSSSHYQNLYDCIEMGVSSSQLRSGSNLATTTTASTYSGMNMQPLSSLPSFSSSSSSSSSSAFSPHKALDSKDPFQFREYARYLQKFSSCATSGANISSTDPMFEAEQKLNREETMSIESTSSTIKPSAPPYSPSLSSPILSPPPPPQLRYGQRFSDPYSPVHSPPPPMPARPIPRIQQVAQYYGDPFSMIPRPNYQPPQYSSFQRGRTTRVKQPPVSPTFVISPAPPASKKIPTKTTTTTPTTSSSFTSPPKPILPKEGHKHQTSSISRAPRQLAPPSTITSSASYEALGGTRRQYLKPCFVPVEIPDSSRPVRTTTKTTTTTTTTTATTTTSASCNRRKIRGNSVPRKATLFGSESKQHLGYYPEYAGYAIPPPQSYRRSLPPSSSLSSPSSSLGQNQLDDDADNDEQEDEVDVEGAASVEKQQEQKQRRRK